MTDMIRDPVAMAEANDTKPTVPVARSTKPVSEALLNEKVSRSIKQSQQLQNSRVLLLNRAH